MSRENSYFSSSSSHHRKPPRDSKDSFGQNEAVGFFLFTHVHRHYRNDNLIESVMSSCVQVSGDVPLKKLGSEGVFMHQQNLLHLATEYSLPCLQVLLGQGFGSRIHTTIMKQLYEADHLEKTPLHLAAANSTSDAVARFLRIYPRLGDSDSEGNTPLHIACKLGRLCEFVDNTLLCRG